MGKIVRVGVTFPSELLSDFDKNIKDMGYRSRSKAIHDTVRAFVNEQKWLVDVKGMHACKRLRQRYHKELVRDFVSHLS